MNIDKELFHDLQEAYDHMTKAKAILHNKILSRVIERIRSICEGGIKISLVVLERHDVKCKPGSLIQYIEIDQVIIHDDKQIQLTGFDPHTDEVVILNLEELNIHELYKLLNISYGNEGVTYKVTPADDL